jgi:hypothetical protein
VEDFEFAIREKFCFWVVVICFVTMAPVACLTTVPAEAQAHQSFHANDAASAVVVIPGAINT